MQNCISVSSMISIGFYGCEWFLWVHTILQNNEFGIVPNIYNVKETAGCIELLVLPKNGEMLYFTTSSQLKSILW